MTPLTAGRGLPLLFVVEDDDESGSSSVRTNASSPPSAQTGSVDGHRRRSDRTGVGALVAVIGLAALLTGCVPQGLAFRTDDRLSIRSPQDRQTISLPLTLRWDIRDFTVAGPGGPVQPDTGYFAVFVDSTPVPPGKPLRYLARKDTTCRTDDGCPDEKYLNDRNIYTTTKTQLVLSRLPQTAEDGKRERHRATIVLLDAKTRRIGESAFELSFDLDRKVPS